MSRPASERFFAKIEVGDCWLWTGGIGHGGYGHFTDYVPRVGSSLAHRWCWEFLVGPIAARIELDHLCKVRHCVNPDHLNPVTSAGNKATAHNANKTKTHCVRGHARVPENLYRTTVGGYACRTCIKERVRARAR